MYKNKFLLLIASLCTFISAVAVDVKTVKRSEPFVIASPIFIDSVDAAQTKYSENDVLKTPIVLSQAKLSTIATLPDTSIIVNTQTNALSRQKQLVLASFSFTTTKYNKVEIKVKGPHLYKVYVNGHERSGKNDYQMGQYDVIVKYVVDTVALSISIEADKEEALSLVDLKEGEPFKRPFNMMDVMGNRYYTNVNLSPSGKYATYGVFWTDDRGKSQRYDRVVEMATGKVVSTLGDVRWMPKSDRLLTTRYADGKTALISINPADMSEEVLCESLPETSYIMSPTEDYLILYKQTEGPRRENGVYEILTPDDRQPGWRNRSALLKMNLQTGLTQTLTFGHKPVSLCDIAPDGKSIIFSFSEARLTERPTSLSTFCKLDLQTMKCDTLIYQDGFINNVAYVPGTNKLAVVGSAEAFNRVGCVLSADLIPNTYDHQLFLFNLDTHKVEAVTRDFNPSISKVIAKHPDGIVYFSADNQDSISLYKLDAKNGKISQVAQPMELVTNFSVCPTTNTILFVGSGACVADRLYAYNINKSKSILIDDCNAERLSSVSLGECRSFSMESERGYKLTGHYYLPANFDNSKKYPVIVHYYGGCSPTSRRFGGGGHYPAHYWNALGYVVLMCNPSGASGFGQEWASRHVNTMGEGVAEDIIEMTKYFADQNQWIDADRIGCVSASYGGFMTQLLLTKTDLFATGISHAGISDHTSYWGEGYWGYSYSQVCAANSYPWTRKDLFVERSPLFNADKIHKPLLFTHGTADTNVPIGESIQMYTALKLLGVPTAFVMVEGENHGIMDFQKRQKWINTMVAWFDRWLKDDDSWWNAIYTPKEL